MSRNWLVLAVLALMACREAPRPSTQPVASALGDSAPTARPDVSVAGGRSVPAGQADSPRLALGARGAVATQEAHASDVGLAVLKRGGNAVDAAVAIAFAMAVTHPSAGNIGGGGFMVVRMASGEATTFDYREVAPRRATRNMYIDPSGAVSRDSLAGAKAAGIPGTVAGMALAHRRFGKLPWRDLVLPAVGLAGGHVIDSYHAEDLERGLQSMRAEGFVRSVAAFSKRDGTAWKAGDRFSQPALQATLTAIANLGAPGFYRGEIAQKMVTEARAEGGIWELADLANYQAVERKPIRFRYRGYEVLTMPPPSGGGVVLRQLLFAAEQFRLAEKPWPNPLATHVYVESARRAYADRNTLLGDPDHADLPLAELLDADYLKRRMGDIQLDRATPSSAVRAGAQASSHSEQTTHFSVVDVAGNAVSNTYTLNTGFGAKLILVDVGVLLNNEMDDFAAKPGTANVYGLVQSEPNAIAPNKRMLSSMTPTIVVKDGALRLVVGSPGGPTTTTTVAQIIRHVLDDGMTVDLAVAAPRLHHQWLPDQIYVESDVPSSLRDALAALGHAIKERGPMGHANCIGIDPVTHGFRAVADVSRDGGKAAAF